jgi:hypothetical protein
LKRELRKLKEEESKEVRDGLKKMELEKKQRILEKEMAHDYIVQENKVKQKVLIQKRLQNNMNDFLQKTLSSTSPVPVNTGFVDPKCKKEESKSKVKA